VPLNWKGLIIKIKFPTKNQGHICYTSRVIANFPTWQVFGSCFGSQAPPAGTYMLCTHMSVRPSVRASVRLSVCASETICFRDISLVFIDGFSPNFLSLVHLGAKMNWLGFGVKRSKFKVKLSRRRRPAIDAAIEWSFLVLCSLRVC